MGRRQLSSREWAVEGTLEARVLDGRAEARRRLEGIQREVLRFKEKHRVVPGLAVILVGNDPASQVYVRAKGKQAAACGFHSVQIDLEETTTQPELLEHIARLNADSSIHGILVQLPLPKSVDEGAIIQAISPAKDVDGFHFLNVGKLGSGRTDTALIPCTPAGCMELLKSVLGEDLSGKSALVIGRSNIVGKPMFHLLLQANATVTVAHSRTTNLPQLCAGADIIVAAVGRPEFVKASWIKRGAVVLDVGINRIAAPELGTDKTRLIGDVEDAARLTAAAITPVPGGVGPMTIAMLMSNTLRAAKVGVEMAVRR